MIYCIRIRVGRLYQIFHDGHPQRFSFSTRFFSAAAGKISSARHEADQRWWLSAHHMRRPSSPSRVHHRAMSALQLMKPLSPQMQMCFEISSASASADMARHVRNERAIRGF